VSVPFKLRDLTILSPVGYRVRPRRIPEIKAIVLHQTGFEWAEKNAMWSRVRAHFVIHRSGLVSQLHPITSRMRFGCGHGNAWAINIECEGNYPLAYRGERPVRWKPEKFGTSVLEEAPAQVEAARSLIVWLSGQVPGLRVGAHRQLEEEKSGCCGPDLWREVGQYGARPRRHEDERRPRHPRRMARAAAHAPTARAGRTARAQRRQPRTPGGLHARDHHRHRRRRPRRVLCGYLARRARRPAPAADIVIRVDCDTSEAVAALKRLRDDVIAAGEEASR
jgi:hypothetical protein